MPPPTWAVYLEFEQRIRNELSRLPNSNNITLDVAGIRQIWNLHNATEKKALGKALCEVERLEALRVQKQVGIHEVRESLQQWIARFINRAELEIDRYREHCQGFMDVLQEYIDMGLNQQLSAAYTAATKPMQKRVTRAGGDTVAFHYALCAAEAALQDTDETEAAEERLRIEDWRDKPPIAPHPDGNRYVNRRWLTQEQEARMRDAARNNGYIGPVFDLGLEDQSVDERWRPLGRIGEGMAGDVWIWGRFSTSNRLIDRVVRKDQHMTGSRWTDVVRWAGNVRDISTRWPLELECQDALQGLGQTNHFVRLRLRKQRHWIDNTARLYRVYTDWCGRRTLRDLILQYNDAEGDVPEPFIWYVAEMLAKAGYMMQYGRWPGPAGANPEVKDPDWQSIVHRDIKVENVFLDTVAGPLYQGIGYPLPRLGDFGLAVQTDRNDSGNPDLFQNSGTPGFQPPELIEWINAEDLTPKDSPFQLDEKCNVWGLGMVLWCLIKRDASPPQAHWPGDPEEDDTYYLEDDTTEEFNLYSQGVLELVDCCLRYDPDDRISFNDILSRVRVAVDGGVTGWDPNSRADPEGAPERDDEGNAMDIEGNLVEDRPDAVLADLPSAGLRTSRLAAAQHTLLRANDAYAIGLRIDQLPPLS